MGIVRSKAVDRSRPYPENVIALLEIGQEITEKQIAGYEEAFSTLSERRQIILKKYFEDKMTLEAIGKELSLGRERIRQIWNEAARELRKPHNKLLITLGPDDYLELLEYRRMCLLNDDLMLALEPEEIPVENLDFGYWALKAFKEEGIKTVGDVLKAIKEPLYYYDWSYYRKREHGEVIRLLKYLKILPRDYVDTSRHIK